MGAWERDREGGAPWRGMMDAADADDVACVPSGVGRS